MVTLSVRRLILTSLTVLVVPGEYNSVCVKAVTGVLAEVVCAYVHSLHCWRLSRH